MDLGLQERAVLITGGASGIGAAAVREFAREGCRVLFWDLSPNASELAKRWSSEWNAPIVGVSVDAAKFDQVQAATAKAEADLGGIDHYVHAAAIGSGKFGFPFLNLTPDDWPRVLEVNVMGMVNCAHAIAPAMIERQSGTMVFLASVAGQIGSPTDPPIAPSKAANINFAQCMAKDLAKHKIRVNTVCPGMVQTPLNQAVWRSWHDRQPPDRRKSYEEWAMEKIRDVVPLGRWQTPEDIANMIVFLSSDRSAQVTGQTVNVDGGFVMRIVEPMSGDDQKKSEPGMVRANSKRNRSIWALVLLLPAPIVGPALWLFAFPGPIGAILAALSKVWMTALPWFWLVKVDRRPVAISKPTRNGLLIGALTGVLIGAVMVGFFAIVRNSIELGPLRSRASEMGIDRPAALVLIFVYIILVNSLLEEYVWRWFVFVKLEEILPGERSGAFAAIFSGVLFTVHHVMVLSAWVDWRLNALASIGVCLGGWIWSWLYLRFRSIWPGYASHVCADLAVFWMAVSLLIP